MPRFDAEETLRLIDAHRVTWVYAVPTMMKPDLQAAGSCALVLRRRLGNGLDAHGRAVPANTEGTVHQLAGT